MDCEAEATITKVYYEFMNRKTPINMPRIKPKIIPFVKKDDKNAIIIEKDGVIATRKSNYNYIDKNYKINDEISEYSMSKDEKQKAYEIQWRQEQERQERQDRECRDRREFRQEVIYYESDASSDASSHDGTRLPCGCFNYYSDEVNAEFNSDCFDCARKGFF